MENKFLFQVTDTGRWQAKFKGLGAVRGYGRSRERAMRDCIDALKTRGLGFLVEDPKRDEPVG